MSNNRVVSPDLKARIAPFYLIHTVLYFCVIHVLYSCICRGATIKARVYYDCWTEIVSPLQVYV